MWLSRLFTSENGTREIEKLKEIEELKNIVSKNSKNTKLDITIENILNEGMDMDNRLYNIIIFVKKQTNAIKDSQDLVMVHNNLNNLIELFYNITIEEHGSVEIGVKVVFFYEKLISEYKQELQIKETESQTLINLYNLKKLYLRGYEHEDVVKNYFGKR